MRSGRENLVGMLAVATAGAVLGGALVVAFAGRMQPEPAFAGGGGQTDLIAEPGPAAGRQRFYLVDPAQKVILVYSSTGETTGFKLVAVRYYGLDMQLGALRLDVPYEANGYSLMQVQNTLEKYQQPRR